MNYRTATNKLSRKDAKEKMKQFQTDDYKTK